MGAGRRRHQPQPARGVQGRCSATTKGGEEVDYIHTYILIHLLFVLVAHEAKYSGFGMRTRNEHRRSSNLAGVQASVEASKHQESRTGTHSDSSPDSSSSDSSSSPSLSSSFPFSCPFLFIPSFCPSASLSPALFSSPSPAIHPILLAI
jgi:hypothetical protein